MDTETLPPIPTPISLRWREFRVRILPALLFVVALAGACYIWQRDLAAPMLVGAVEVRSANVAVPYPGKILQLNVDDFEVVTQGTPVAILVPSDPRAALSVIQSELDLLHARVDPHLAEAKNQIDYQQLRMDWLLQRAELATARVNYELAKSDLVRTQELHEARLVPDSVYDIAVTAERALATEVMERSNLVTDAERTINNLQAFGASPLDLEPTLLATLKMEEKKLEQAAAETEPITLVAPIDGAVTLFRQAGENVTEGTPLMTITAVQPEKIISYLRQPIPFEPKVGMPVEVRTRAMQSQTAVGAIKNVGTHFEAITNALAVGKLGTAYDLGLPIEITVPAGLKIHPGELVDLTIRRED